MYPVEFVRLVASLMPKEPEVTIAQLSSVCLTRSSKPLSRKVFKTALILQATDEDIRMNAFSVAFGDKADIDRYGNRMLRRASCGSELRMNDYPVVEPSTPSPRNEMLRDVAIVFGCNLQNF